MDYCNPSLTLLSHEVTPGAIRWRSPSNIALVKYWGKHGRQLPRNASVSLTLDGAATDTTLHYAPRLYSDGQPIDLELVFEGKTEEAFSRKTREYFASLLEIYPFLRQLSFRVETANSFPHSAGIASSASGMSALALCLVSLEEELFEPLSDRNAFFRKASYLARLGSGSACRSVYPRAAVWGQSDAVSGSSDDYAVPIDLSPVFAEYHDDILLISRSPKAVSSRAGHGLMDGNPYAAARYQQADRRLAEMASILRGSDTERFVQITESEALTLHALMMSSMPSYTLLEPNTLEVINRIYDFRRETGLPVCFTLDAGPNIHLLYPDSAAEATRHFIRERLLLFCDEGHYLADRVGNGPQQLEVSTTTGRS